MRANMFLKLKVMGALFSQYNTQTYFQRWKEFAEAKTMAIEEAKIARMNQIEVMTIKINKSGSKNQKNSPLKSYFLKKGIPKARSTQNINIKKMSNKTITEKYINSLLRWIRLEIKIKFIWIMEMVVNFIFYPRNL